MRVTRVLADEDRLEFGVVVCGEVEVLLTDEGGSPCAGLVLVCFPALAVVDAYISSLSTLHSI